MKEYKHTRSELETLIDELVIGLNSKRNREIIRDKLFEGMTIHQIAEKHGLSEMGCHMQMAEAEGAEQEEILWADIHPKMG